MSDSGEIDRGQVNRSKGRVLRNRKYRRPFEDTKSDKRLFTPEIKRHLKTWLIRRRENPYPNREEKNELAAKTGLTYIQICNWFANWRRKLKNAGRNVDKFTWSTLIKSYNNQIIGNLEHLSISSDDSIWEETDLEQPRPDEKELSISFEVDHCYTSQTRVQSPRESVKITRTNSKESSTLPRQSSEPLPQCFQISSTTDFIREPKRVDKERSSKFSTDTEKKRRNLRDRNWNYQKASRGNEPSPKKRNPVISLERVNSTSPVLLSKWKRSAACFRPSCKSYFISGSYWRRKSQNQSKEYEACHGREELDAAEALTSLSHTNHGCCSIHLELHSALELSNLKKYSNSTLNSSSSSGHFS